MVKRNEAFPLYLHRSGHWIKKIRYKTEYFGKDRQAALEEYFRVKDYLMAGKARPPKTVTGLTVSEMCNVFLDYKHSQVEAGELKNRTFDEYFKTCRKLVSLIGANVVVNTLQPIDFKEVRRKVSANKSAKTVHNEIGRMKSPFKFAYDNALIDKPVRFGNYFKRPKQSTLRKERQAKGDRTLSSEAIRDLIGQANTQLKAMILLGIGNGLGNGDCAQLEFQHLDLQAGWLNYPRPKTFIDRRSKLAESTVIALNAWIERRRLKGSFNPKQPVFICASGKSWHTECTRCPISQAFRKILKDTGHYRYGIGFYTLRRMFETVAGTTTDQPAVDLAMGHTRNDMASIYRLEIDDSRLENLSLVMERWLNG